MINRFIDSRMKLPSSHASLKMNISFINFIVILEIFMYKILQFYDNIASIFMHFFIVITAYKFYSLSCEQNFYYSDFMRMTICLNPPTFPFFFLLLVYFVYNVNEMLYVKLVVGQFVGQS